MTPKFKTARRGHRLTLAGVIAAAALTLAPGAYAADNGWGTTANGDGQYHESNSATADNGWKTTANGGGQYHESNGSAQSDSKANASSYLR